MNREQVVKDMVAANHARTGRPHSRIWDSLYWEFETSIDTNIRRLAYVACVTNLEYLEQNGYMPKFVEFAQKHLGEKPALPEQKRTPWQGSLMEEERA